MIFLFILANKQEKSAKIFCKTLMTISKLCTDPKINFVLWEQFVI
jgi:hypothetical protein